MARDQKKLKAARDRYREKQKLAKDAAVATSTNAPSEREKLLVKRFKTWEHLTEQLKELRAKENEKVAAATANLRAACEDGVAVGDTTKAMAKLKSVERAWSKLDEAKAERVENLKAAKDDLAAAYSRLRELAENASQLQLFEADDAEGKGDAEDEEDED